MPTLVATLPAMTATIATQTATIPADSGRVRDLMVQLAAMRAIVGMTALTFTRKPQGDYEFWMDCGARTFRQKLTIDTQGGVMAQGGSGPDGWTPGEDAQIGYCRAALAGCVLAFGATSIAV